MTDLLHNWVMQHRRLQNYMAAIRELQLTPQEQYAYRHHLSNLERGGVQDSTGSETSSYLSLGTTIDGRYYMLPAVWDNQILGTPDAVARARAVGLDKWPSYSSQEEGEARYAQMHRYMERDTNRDLYAGSNPRPQSPNLSGVEGSQPAIPPQQH